MSNEFKKVNGLIKNYFGDNLVSLLIFGSACRRRNFKIESDLDYIIILKNNVKNQDKISRALKTVLNKYFALLSFNIYSKDSFVNIVRMNDWLVLSIKLGYFIIYDKDNFFKNTVENAYLKTKAKKIAPLGWRINTDPPDASLINHLLTLSNNYLESAKKVYKSKIYNVANLLLLDSIHCYVSALMLQKNIFITKGEIVQCFTKNYNPKSIGRFKNGLLEVEQICGQIEKISFNFYSLGGKMKFISNKNFLKQFFCKKLKLFCEFKIALLQ